MPNAHRGGPPRVGRLWYYKKLYHCLSSYLTCKRLYKSECLHAAPYVSAFHIAVKVLRSDEVLAKNIHMWKD